MFEGLSKQVAETEAGTRVAVLVDGENISNASAELILNCAKDFGNPTIRRVYGDMRERHAWEADHRFSSIHTGHGRSKNTADIKLVVDAMDLALSGKANCFLIASCDGDFAPLATYLREARFVVIGLGKSKSSSSLFREACSEYRAILEDEKNPISAEGFKAQEPAIVEKPSGIDTKVVPSPKPKKPVLSRIDAAVHRQCKNIAPKNAFVSITTLGQAMAKVELIKRKECGRATWLKYFNSLPDLYITAGSGPEARVRLKSL